MRETDTMSRYVKQLRATDSPVYDEDGENLCRAATLVLGI